MQGANLKRAGGGPDTNEYFDNHTVKMIHTNKERA